LSSNLVDVTLIDQRDYHLFQPLLYKSRRARFGGKDRLALLADGTIVPYDSLIIAAGSQTSFFGHNERQKWAPGMKSVEEAKVIRHKFLYAFEGAERLTGSRAAPKLAPG